MNKRRISKFLVFAIVLTSIGNFSFVKASNNPNLVSKDSDKEIGVVDVHIEGEPQNSTSVEVIGSDSASKIRVLDIYRGNEAEGDKLKIKTIKPSTFVSGKIEPTTGKGVGEVTYVYEAEENGNYTVKAEDVAGNSNQSVFRVSNVFKHEPVIEGPVKLQEQELLLQDGTYSKENINKTNSAQDLKFTVKPDYWVDYQEGDVVNKIEEVEVIKVKIDDIKKGDKKEDNSGYKEKINKTVAFSNREDDNVNRKGSELSDISLTFEYSGEYEIQIKDKAGNILLVPVKIDHIDHRTPIVSAEDQEHNENQLKTLTSGDNWSNSDSQEIELRYTSRSGTKFNFEDKTTEDLKYVIEGDTLTIWGKTRVNVKEPEKDGELTKLLEAVKKENIITGKGNVATVTVKVYSNNSYNIILKDSVGKIGNNILVDNFDWDLPDIKIKEVKKATNTMNLSNKSIEDLSRGN